MEEPMANYDPFPACLWTCGVVNKPVVLGPSPMPWRDCWHSKSMSYQVYLDLHHSVACASPPGSRLEIDWDDEDTGCANAAGIAPLWSRLTFSSVPIPSPFLPVQFSLLYLHPTLWTDRLPLATGTWDKLLATCGGSQNGELFNH